MICMIIDYISFLLDPYSNSISDEEIDPSDILSLDNLEPLGLPTSPPVSPAPPKFQPISPLKTPASPLKAPASRLKPPASPLKAPASPLKAPASPLKTSASPKMTPAKGTEKSNAACSPKSGWKLRRLKPAQSSTQVKLCSVKPLPDQNNSTPIITNQSEPLASQEYTLKENSIYRVEKASSNETSHQNGNKDNRAAARVLLHSSGAQTLQNNAESVSGHSSVTSPSPSVSGQGSISRARPVTGERPSIQSRCSSKAPSISTSSGESDSSGFGDSSSRSHDTLSSSSSSSRKSEISNQSGGPIVLRRALTVSKSTAYRDSTYASSESDSDAEVDEVFCKDKPAPSAITKYTIASTPKADMSVEEYTEYLSKTLKRIQDPIPHLPNPRLELTFRSAFDDIRLFLANNRGDDEVFPVPRQSERGGKAIKKLKACLKTVA